MKQGGIVVTYPKGSRGECMRHSRIRCGECEYVEELEEANKRYKQALEFYAYENGNPAIDGIIARKALKGGIGMTFKLGDYVKHVEYPKSKVPLHLREQMHVDVVNEYKEKERNLKKDIGKSSLDILNGNSDALYNVKHTIDILDAFNNVILGLFKLSDEQWVFNTINVNTDAIDQYKNIEKEIGMELNELAGKIEIMRNLIFAEIIDWHMMSDLFKALEREG